MSNIKILIVDDQQIVCEGLKTILQLEDDFEIAGICHNGQEAIDFCRSVIPDIILMDARMPVINGITATKEICKMFPQTKILILTTFNEETLVYEGLQNGARGFLLKDMNPDELCKTIRAVQAGGVCLHPDVTQKILEMVSSKQPKAAEESMQDHVYAQLTNREKEVLKLIGRGLSNTEIAAELFIVEGTVKSHVSSLLAKLGVRDRTQLAILAQKNMT